MGELKGRSQREPEERLRLLGAARAGDAEAFRALFTPDLDLAWRMALRITGEPASADDALQEGLISAYRALDRVEPRNLRGWFVRIVQNAARDAGRRERRHPTIQIQTHEEEGGGAEGRGAAELPAGRASDPAGVVEGRELAAQLRAALREIPEERRTAILLFDVDGYTYAEIAEITESSLGTVKSRISRGREELRSLLADLRPGTQVGERPLGGRDE
ncbi:MAG: RNA polymerase sigma factor [Candidatus Limnocylindrus sp.]|jgi:RNA polymerase sigma-70 factor (ECF subfamily)